MGKAAMNWRSGVYRAGEEPWKNKEWRSIRWKAILRDHFICQHCRKCFRYGHGLTVHHKRPRDQGGDDTPYNLISLCSPCHDQAELNIEQEYPEVSKTVQSWTNDLTYPSEIWVTRDLFLVLDKPNHVIAWRTYYQMGETTFRSEYNCLTNEKTLGVEI